ncbi:molybdenum cofactor biosynthesis prote [Paxillus ammoniavirescens]|nr:molybdenum cofactor biosynthesis prote [Paxillus ammoniavirescens]
MSHMFNSLFLCPPTRRVTGTSKFLYHMSYSSQSVSHLQARVQDRIARIDAQRPFSPALVDSFNRKHDYLRLSLTERCNLRCFYCMPSQGVELSPRQHILTDDEIIRLASLFVRSGVRKIRLTGGEPTVRKGLDNIIRQLNELRLHGLDSIGMTSNGLALHRRLSNLVNNGLTHLNLSLDTLDPFKFEIMTRRPGHDAVLRTLDVALSCAGLRSVKLNVVVVKGLNDSEVLDFVELTKDKKLSVRFIEFMPFTGNKWDKIKMVPSAELLDKIRQRHPIIERAPDELNDTARSWKIAGYKGNIGFISSMSDHFCSSCNRLRLTADGQIKVCLFDAKEVSLRDEMRRGATDEELLQVIGSAVIGKKEKHTGMEDIDVVANRPMILIGGPQKLLSHLNSRPPFSTFVSTFSPRKGTRRERRWSSHSNTNPPRLTHLDSDGRPSMVDVGNKESTKRTATATGHIYIPKIAYDLVTGTRSPAENEPNSLLGRARVKASSKGDVLTVAQLAAIMGCKRTSELIPLCHPLQLSNILVTLTPEVAAGQETAQHDSGQLPYRIKCTATVSCEGKTGVEMEALTAVSVGLLAVWDMLKAVAGKEMMISNIIVSHKSGGKTGDFTRDGSRESL